MVDLIECHIWNRVFKSGMNVVIKSERSIQGIYDKVTKFFTTEIQDKYKYIDKVLLR
jgi:hypothetical protein